MASTQGSVYGHSDCWGLPFDFYSNQTVAGVTGSLATGQSIAMQTGKLVFALTGAVTLTITLPLNPPDGADAEIQNEVGSGATATVTVVANTNDVIIGTAGTALTAGTTFRYKYALNGDITKGVSPRTWIRVQ